MERPTTPTSEFRIFLQGELIRRCKANPSYSLRAFAKLLRIDPSTLSQVLRGKRKFSRTMQFKLGERLGLGPEEMASFVSGSRQGSSQHETRTTDLTLDSFQVIADWYHYAIFELVTVRGFRPDARWIASRLGITASEVNVAVERLIRLGLIEVGSDGTWRQGAPLITTVGNPFTAIAFRKLQAQVLSMGMTALEAVPLEWRDQTSMTMAINRSRIPEAKERIKKFRRELCEYLQQDVDRDSVYQLGVSFYPLTQVKER